MEILENEVMADSFVETLESEVNEIPFSDEEKVFEDILVEWNVDILEKENEGVLGKGNDNSLEMENAGSLEKGSECI